MGFIQASGFARLEGGGQVIAKEMPRLWALGSGQGGQWRQTGLIFRETGSLCGLGCREAGNQEPELELMVMPRF